MKTKLQILLGLSLGLLSMWWATKNTDWSQVWLFLAAGKKGYRQNGSHELAFVHTLSLGSDDVQSTSKAPHIILEVHGTIDLDVCHTCIQED